MDERSDVYRQVLALIDTCAATWRAAWSPGDHLTEDETMVYWRGTGEVHVTY